MTLFVHVAPEVGVLADALADVLREPLADPFAAEIVAVPNVGMRDWLTQRLACSLGATADDAGIAANIQMPFLSEFTAGLLGGSSEPDDPWRVERLTWTILHLLDRGIVEVPGWHRRRDHAAGRVAAAGHIAELFDRYVNHRPQMIAQWSAGVDGDGTVDDQGLVGSLAPAHAWQPHVWRAVRKATGAAPRFADHESLLADVRASAPGATRVAVFGVGSLSAGRLDVVRAAATGRDVHFFAVHPSPVAWARPARALGGSLVPRSSIDVCAPIVNPLLRSWGRPSAELAALVAGLPATVTQLDAAKPDSRTVLGHVQHALRTDATTVAGAVDLQDGTVQIHACHGVTRQIEVARDALTQAFVADPTLHPRDVLVVTPDLDRFAPLVGSVFGRSSVPLPVRVSDVTSGVDNPLADALLVLLATLAGRCTGPDMLLLLGQHAVRRAFGFDDDDVAVIDEWVDAIGTTWGLDGAHRAEAVPAHIVAGTWRSTLDRLLVGAAMPAPTPRTGTANIVPFDGVDARHAVVAGRLAALIEALIETRSIISSPRPMPAWVAEIETAVQRFLEPHPDDTWMAVALADVLAGLADAAAGNDVPLGFADARSTLTAALARRTGRLFLRSGAITVTSMTPVHLVPARIICVLGLDDNALRGGTDGDDVLAHRPCVGERDQRADGRQMLLDLLAGARDRLIVTFEGADITTNQPLPTPVVLTELLDAVRSTATAPVDPDALIRRHPRHGFDVTNLGGSSAAGRASAPFTADQAMYDAALAHRRASSRYTPWPLLSAPDLTRVRLGDLIEGCTRPETVLLRRRVDAGIPQAVDEIDTNIPLQFTGLDRYALGDELLALRRAGADEIAIGRWQAAKRLSGELPPRSLADAVLDDTAAEVDAIVRAVGERGLPLDHAVEEIQIALALHPAGNDRHVDLVDSVRAVCADTLVRVRYTRPSSASIIAAVIELAAVVLATPEAPWNALVVTRGKSGAASPTVVEIRQRHTGAASRLAAQRVLDVAAEIFRRALREPLPIFPTSTYALATTGTIDDDDLEREMQREMLRFLWHPRTADEILAITQHDDETPSVAARPERRALAYARLIWGVVVNFADVGDALLDHLVDGGRNA